MGRLNSDKQPTQYILPLRRYAPWKLLPGDALVVECTYVHGEGGADVVGGLETDDEMCIMGLGITAALPGVGFLTGFMVRPGDPFLPTYVGNDRSDYGRHPGFKTAAMAQHPAGPNAHTFVPLAAPYHCEIFVRHESKTFAYVANPPTVSLLAGLGFWLGAHLATRLVAFLQARWGIHMNDRARRNNAVNLVQITFSTCALPATLAYSAPYWRSASTFDAVGADLLTPVRWLMYVQVILYLHELTYRIGARFEVVIHHVFTIAILLYLPELIKQSLAFEFCLKLAATLILLAMADQPKSLALVLKAFKSRHWRPVMLFAGVWYVVSKVVVVAGVVVILASAKSGADASFQIGKHSFQWWYTPPGGLWSVDGAIAIVSVMLAGLMVDNFFTGYTLIAIARGGKPMRRGSIANEVGRGDEDEDESGFDFDQERALSKGARRRLSVTRASACGQPGAGTLPEDVSEDLAKCVQAQQTTTPPPQRFRLALSNVASI